MPETVDGIAEGYVRAALQLAQHQPSLVETWLGPSDWRPGPRRPVADIRTQIDSATEQLKSRAHDSASVTRTSYLEHQLAALTVAARRLAGETIAFADEARAALGSDVAWLMERVGGQAGETHSTLDRLLPGRGSLAERYRTFRLAQSLPSDKVAPTLAAAVTALRSRAHAHLALPPSEGASLEAASVVGYEAHAVYSGQFQSTVRVDTSRPLDVAHLVWMAAHETYPGHHVQHVLADRDAVRAQGWLERALLPAFGRHIVCAEGTADVGAALLLEGDAFAETCREVAKATHVSADRVPALIEVHHAARALDANVPAIAQDYLDGGLGAAAAAERLAAEALVLDPDRMVQFIERQRSRVLAIPIGRRLIERELTATPHPRRWERLRELSTTLTLRDRQ